MSKESVAVPYYTISPGIISSIVLFPTMAYLKHEPTVVFSVGSTVANVLTLQLVPPGFLLSVISQIVTFAAKQDTATLNRSHWCNERDDG